MEKFNTLEGIAAPMPLINIDTDMLIPKQFLKTIKRTGLGENLFFEMRYDQNGNVFSIGSDGCDYVHTDNYQPISHMNFYTPQHEQIRQQILTDDSFREQNLENYSNFMNGNSLNN